MSFLIRDIIVHLDQFSGGNESYPERQSAIQKALQKKMGKHAAAISHWSVYQEALDVRRNQPRLVYSLRLEGQIQVLQKATLSLPSLSLFDPPRIKRWSLPTQLSHAQPVVVVGAGPAGLFAALTLARAGAQVILLERGKPVEARSRDVSALYKSGELNPESNVCYGEGGAGTYSDGKLYTRVNDPQVRSFYQDLVAFGAKQKILSLNRPHIGTDRLVKILKNVRQQLTDLGVDIRFESAMTDLQVRDGRVAGVRTQQDTIDAKTVILATGHSAEQIWVRLYAQGVVMEARPFAMGYRVEHPQTHIDQIRYGKWASHPALPAADYSLRYRSDAHDTYSFCMCPGGVVVATPTRPNQLCINGMSHAARSGRFANSALVTTVHPQDILGWEHHRPATLHSELPTDPLFAGVRLQRVVESRAYTLGGGAFKAPAMRVTDFVNTSKKVAEDPRRSTSYRRGLHMTSLQSLYPESLQHNLAQALRRFDRKMPGFITDEATLIGVETRTASPIRVLRNDDGEALNHPGLYPCGEGMGYGGGIASAAIDGIRTANRVLQSMGAEPTTVTLTDSA